ncbi:MAG: DUF655 domain-containing protein [Candidatus Micrarchaeota archaeon]|nr:DUF655 domain-containing protein [Candidatus Micrarchaeota archaeon]
MEQREERREEYAFVLDFMPTGKSFSNRAEPIAQLIGEEWFTLLEANPKPNVALTIGERVYIGKEEREKISLIKTRIAYNELTQTAKNGLNNVVSEMVAKNEAKFIEFFNKAGPLNIREHSLELLPGIGKKHLESILKARNEKPFANFSDLSARVPLLQSPAKLISERILSELMGNERFYMFTKPYTRRPRY